MEDEIKETRIQINEEEFILAGQLDNTEAILKKYAKKKGIPRDYFRIEPSEISLTEGPFLNISNVANEISDLTLVQVVKQQEILLKKFPLKNVNELIIIWLVAQIDDQTSESQIIKKNISKLKKINNLFFSSEQVTKDRLKDYRNKEFRGRVADESKDLEKIDRNKKRIGKRLLDEKEPFETSPFSLKETSVEISLSLQNNEPLIYIFDAICTSKTIPFVMLKTEIGTIYTKIDKNTLPLDAWINYQFPEHRAQIIIKFLSGEEKASGPTSNENKKDSLYSTIIWDENNRLLVSIGEKSLLEARNIAGSLLDNLEKLEYTINYVTLLEISGTFTVNHTYISKPIFTDLVLNHPLVSRYLFMNEFFKTTLDKDIFNMFFDPQEKHNPRNAIKLNFKNQINYLEIKIGHAKNLRDIEILQNYLKITFSLYNQNYDAIYQDYKDIIPRFTSKMKQYTQTQTQTQKEVKTKKRLNMLTKARPDIFDNPNYSKHYSRVCQKKKQPYLIPPDEIKQTMQNLGDTKVLEFPTNSGDWYACEPRDDTDPSFVWPGLQTVKLKDGSKNYFPCCFSRDQYGKTKSKYKDYLHSLQAEEKQEEEDIVSKYIVNARKILKPNQVGEIPPNVEVLVEEAGVTYELLRVGSPNRPDSFLHCLDRIFDEEYLFSDNKISYVYRTREKIAENLGAKRFQETYNYSTQELQNILNEPNAYIDPLVFKSIAQIYYKCNIILFVVSKKYPRGNFILPNHKYVYFIPSSINERLPFVILFLYQELETKNYPYQIDFAKIDQVSEDIGKFDYDSFIKQSLQSYIQMNRFTNYSL